MGPGRLHRPGHHPLQHADPGVCPVHSGWNWYCRAVHPTERKEAITIDSLLLAAVGKAASNAKQTTQHLTPLHGRADVLKRLIAAIGAALRPVMIAAKRFKNLDRWGRLLATTATAACCWVASYRATAGSRFNVLARLLDGPPLPLHPTLGQSGI
jgi:hypothetical protein